jgi:hypothetical protein
MSEKEWQSDPNAGLLHLVVTIRCEREGVPCGYWVGLKLGQHVQLVRGDRRIISATTWQNSYTGTISKAQLIVPPTLLAVDAGTLLLNFVQDFRLANPQ